LKLVVQIPCFNESETLEKVIREIPRDIDGIEHVEIMVIDDGSTDDTVAIAHKCGVDHVISHGANRGLAAAFRSGFERCRQIGADIVVNTDGDMQYDGSEIPKLIVPVLLGEADVVVGDRDPVNLVHFSPIKRMLQKVGSWVVSGVSKTPLPDATSGFRAYSRDALYRLTIETTFSHSLETLIQAAGKGLVVTSVAIAARRTVRQSRLAPSKRYFILRSIATIVRGVTYYRPLTFYWSLGVFMLMVGGAPMVRFLWFFFNGDGRGQIQSLVIGGALLAMGFTCMLFGVMAAQINSNRRILEGVNERLRRLESNTNCMQAKEKGQFRKPPPHIS